MSISNKIRVTIFPNEYVKLEQTKTETEEERLWEYEECAYKEGGTGMGTSVHTKPHEDACQVRIAIPQ